MEAGLSSPLSPSSFLQSTTRKREAPWQNPGVVRPNPIKNWNPTSWDWDSIGFTAKSSENHHQEPQEVHELTNEAEGKKDFEEEAQNMTEEPGPRKRIRLGSPRNLLACQVDDCKADLSEAKSYHRRHKVCEHHSKEREAVVGGKIQRFCQQCSRFHLISEFDERKRSCRHRLLDHNRRRRKNQPDDVFSQLSPTPIQMNNGEEKLDIAKLLTKLPDSQGNGVINHSVQFISKTQLFSGTSSVNSAQTSKKAFVEDFFKESANLSLSSRKNLPITLAEGHDADVNLCLQPMQLFPVEVVEKSSTFCSNAEICEPQIQENDSSLSLQLFSSEDDNCFVKSNNEEKHLSSESSNPTNDHTPESSPPVVLSLLQSNLEKQNENHEIISITQEEGTTTGIASNMLRKPLDVLKYSKRKSHNPTAYSSSSGSDLSPSTLNSNSGERTGHIFFKLFDKDPSSLPSTLRSEILSWLSKRPLEMESYIRPGCVVLSVYLSMLTKDWVELEENFLYRVALLIHSKSGFWASSRFLVRANKCIASHRKGKIREWITLTAPELISVSPVAIVSGHETTLILRGHNLAIPGTRIHCTFKGGYTTKEVHGSICTGIMYDNSICKSFRVRVQQPGFFGRCFIEVENGFKGNSFPVIIANSSICQEIRLLEAEFKGDWQLKEAVHFLNELGWLFQRKNNYCSSFQTFFSSTRFKFLIIFSVERDWIALTTTLLDMIAEKCLKDDASMQEFVDMLIDTHLLCRSIARKCRKMVDLLLRYKVQNNINGSKIYPFPPDVSGPGGVTPLHMVASMENSEEIVDALTSDPQEIGLRCWSVIMDEKGYSPFMYATMRKHYSYNNLVAWKLDERRNGQISILVDSQKPQLSSCSQCAVLLQTRHPKRVARNHGLLRHSIAFPILAIAAVFVSVCLFYRGAPRIDGLEIEFLVPFKWGCLNFGPR